jgi:gluconate 2-dehydrogenase alpha chain
MTDTSLGSVSPESGTDGQGPATALDPGERRTLDALVDRIFPAGPRNLGGAAIGAGGYIDRALAGPYCRDLQFYRALLGAIKKHAGDFAALDVVAQDAIVAEIESGSLAGMPSPAERTAFDLLWRHTREGLFGDPEHGGNRNFAGWRAIGFPGAQYGYLREDQEIDRVVDRQPTARADLPQSARHLAASFVSGDVKDRPADVIIVGGGPVGAFVALSLVRRGLEVTILEAGPARTGRERVMDELLATSFRNVGGAAKFNAEIPTWRRRPGDKANRAVRSQGLETALGGNSVAWGAVAMRFYEDDFRVRSATVARYGEEAIPEGTTLADWPLAYADLAPYYDEAEGLLGVSGQAGNQANPGASCGNPFEAPRSKPYDMPPLRASGLGALFAEAAHAEGHHPFPLPAAILTTPWQGRHACTYCSFCSRFGCHVDAKASAQNTVLTEALATGRLRILTDARVLEILADESGAAAGVRYLDGSEERRLEANAVVLACYAFENTRLLLLSKDQRHKRGLGNETGQVGRHYMTRQQPSVHALFAGRKLNRFIGPTAQAMAIADLSADHFDHSGLGFIRGGRIAAFNQYLPAEASGVTPPDLQRWGAPWRDFFLDAYNSTAMLFIDPEILPYENNRLDLDPDVSDALGRPVTRITFDIGENERRMIAFLQERAERIARRMGATRIWRRPPLTGPISTHDVGGTRMGDNPENSVVDGYGRVHDTPGLVVLGGSTFVSLPAVNPALTMLALALRSAAALADRLTASRA